MAWPSTPLTSYVSNTVPAIKAFDLNSFQMGVNGIINGTYSHKAVVIDGTGGTLATPLSGALILTQSISSTATPNPTLPIGTFYQNQLVAGWAVVDPIASLARGVNVKGVSYNSGSKGTIIEFNTRFDPAGDAIFPVSVSIDSAISIAKSITYTISGTNPSRVNVYLYNAAGNVITPDGRFTVIAFNS